MSLTFQPLTDAEIPAVSTLAASIWRAHYVPDIVSAEQIEYMIPRVCSEDHFRHALHEKKHRIWTLKHNDMLAGYSALENKNNDIWFLDKLYVSPTLHGKGFGTAFFNHVKLSLLPKELKLRVNRKNYKAVNFYFKHGFTIETLDTLDIGNGFVMDDFIMRKLC